MMNDHYSFLAFNAFQQMCGAMESALTRPSTVYKPVLRQVCYDREIPMKGWFWSCRHGDCNGTGETPEKAYEDFDRAWKSATGDPAKMKVGEGV